MHPLASPAPTRGPRHTIWKRLLSCKAMSNSLCLMFALTGGNPFTWPYLTLLPSLHFPPQKRFKPLLFYLICHPIYSCIQNRSGAIRVIWTVATIWPLRRTNLPLLVQGLVCHWLRHARQEFCTAIMLFRKALPHHCLQQPEHEGINAVGMTMCSLHPGFGAGCRLTICSLWHKQRGHVPTLPHFFPEHASLAPTHMLRAPRCQDGSLFQPSWQQCLIEL